LAYEEQIYGINIETKAKKVLIMQIMQFFLSKRGKSVRYKKNYFEAKPTCLVQECEIVVNKSKKTNFQFPARPDARANK
jgi:hypothetical protein